MAATKNDFYEAIKRLGPHACLEFVLNKTDDIYQYLNEEIELDKVQGVHPIKFDMEKYCVSVTAREMSKNTLYVTIVKKPEGFLGWY